MMITTHPHEFGEPDVTILPANLPQGGVEWFFIVTDDDYYSLCIDYSEDTTLDEMAAALRKQGIPFNHLHVDRRMHRLSDDHINLELAETE